MHWHSAFACRLFLAKVGVRVGLGGRQKIVQAQLLILQQQQQQYG